MLNCSFFLKNMWFNRSESGREFRVSIEHQERRQALVSNSLEVGLTAGLREMIPEMTEKAQLCRQPEGRSPGSATLLMEHSKKKKNIPEHLQICISCEARKSMKPSISLRQSDSGCVPIFWLKKIQEISSSWNVLESLQLRNPYKVLKGRKSYS